MKTCNTRFLLLALCVLSVFLFCPYKARPAAITIGAQPLHPPLNTCVNDTFRVCLTNHSSQAYQDLDLAIQFDGNAEYLACSLAVKRDTTGYSLFRIASLAANDSVILYYAVTISCAAIPTVEPQSSNESLSLTDHFALLWQGAWLTDFSPSSNSYQTSYPFLIKSLASGDDVNAQFQGLKGESFYREFAYRNTGTGPFTGVIHFEDTHDSQVRIDSLFIYFGNSAIPSYSLAYPYADNWQTLISNLASNFADPAARIRFKEKVSILTCLSTVSQSTLTLHWGCENDPCRTLVRSDFTVSKSNRTPFLLVSRSLPVDNLNSSCTNTFDHWRVQIKNTGNATAYNVIIYFNPFYPQVSQNFFGFKSTFIDYDSVHVHLDSLSDPRDHDTVTFIHDVTAPGERASCIDAYVPHALSDWSDTIFVMKAGESVTVDFATYRCCIEDTAFFSQPNIEFDYWQISVARGYDGCGVSLVNHDPALVGNGDSQHYPGPYSHSLNLQQFFETDVTDMTGDTDCSGPPQRFAVQNIFPKAANYVSYLTLTPDVYYGLNPHGKIKVEIAMDEGLKIMPQEYNTVYFYNGTSKWLPYSIHSDSTIFGDTINTTFYAYFDIDSFPSIDSLVHFLHQSYLQFYMRACCPALASSHFDVRTYLSPNAHGNCPTCWYPFSRVSDNINVHCRGCITPGMIPSAFSLRRINLGYEDKNNDGLIDGSSGPVPIIAGTYARADSMSFNTAIVGDTLESSLYSFFEDGDETGTPTGVNYASLRNHWAGLYGGDGRFKHLYLEQMFDNGVLALVDLKAVSATLEIQYERNDTPHTSLLTLDPQRDIFRNNGEFFYDLSLDSLYARGLDTAYEYEPHDMFILKSQYRVCKTYSDHAGDNVYGKRKSRITNFIYLRKDTLQRFHGFDTFLLSPEKFHTSSDPLIRLNSLLPEYLYLCESRAGKFNFYSYWKTNYLWTTYGLTPESLIPAEANIHPECMRTVSLVGYAEVSPHYDFDPFPYEFRKPPSLVDTFKISVPNGYRVARISRAETIFRYSTPFYQVGVYAPDLTGFNPTSDVELILHDSDFVMADSASITHHDIYGRYSSDKWLLADLNYQPVLTVDFIPECGVVPETTSIAVRDVHFVNIGCQQDPVDVWGYNGNFSTFYKVKPNLKLNNPSGEIQATGKKIFWNINLENQELPAALNSKAVNVFLKFASQGGRIVVDSVNKTSSNYQTVLGSLAPDAHNFYRAGDISKNISNYYTIWGHLAQCAVDSVHRHDSITVQWGWNCDGYPDSLTYPNLCHRDSSYLPVYQNPVGLDTTLLMQPNEYVSCDTSTFSFCILSNQNGGAQSFYLRVWRDAELDSLPALDSLVYFNQNNDRFAYALPAPSYHTPYRLYDLTSFNTVLGSDGLAREKMCVFLNFRPRCGYNGTLPWIEVVGEKFCGDTIRDTISYHPWSPAGTQCSPLSVSISPNGPTTFCAPGSVTLSANSSAGLVYQWLLNGQPVVGANASSYSASASGAYSLHVQNGTCSGTSASIDVTVHPQPGLYVVPATAKICPGDTAVLTAYGAASYSWTNFGSNSMLVVSPAHTTTYYVTGTGTNGCSVTDSVEAMVYPSAVPHITGNPVACDSSTTVLNAGPGYASWSWLPGNQTTQSIVVGRTGNYTVTVTDTNGCHGQDILQVTIDAPIRMPLPSDTAVVHPPIVPGGNGSILISARGISGGTPPFSYSWSTGDSIEDLVDIPADSYTLTVTDSLGCTASRTYTLPEPPSECGNGFTTYTQGGYGNCGYPGQFMQNHFAQTFQGGLTIGCTGSTVYSLSAGCFRTVRNFLPSGTKNKGPTILDRTYRDPRRPDCSYNGNCACAVDTDCVPANPPFYSNVFAGQVLTLALNLGFDTVPGFDNSNYPLANLYYMGSGPFYGRTVKTIFNEASARLGGCNGSIGLTYTLSALNSTVDLINKSWDNGLCPNGSCGILSCSMPSIRSLELEAALMPYPAQCSNGNSGYVLSAVHGGQPPYHYLWNTGDTVADLLDVPTGIYSLTVTDDLQHSLVRYAYVFNDPDFVNPAYFTNAVTHDTAAFTDQSADPTGTANKAWSWNFGDPASGTNNSNLQNPVHVFSSDGLYNVTLTVTYTSGAGTCSDSWSDNICILPQASCSAPASTLCAGDSLLLTASVTGTNSHVFQWQKDGVPVSGASSATYYAKLAGNYSCKVTNSCGMTVTNSVSVSVIPIPSTTISAAGPVTFCAGDSVRLTASIDGSFNYQWTRNGNALSGAITTNYTATSSGTYACIASNSCGNVVSNSIVVLVNALQPVSVSIAATQTTFCTGTNVTFTATPVNGGSSPSYQWKRNGVNVGTNSNSWSDNTLANNDNISCILTSNATPCATGSPATSNSITVTVQALQPVSVSISSTATTICAGTSVTFTATPSNGGSTPSYQWKNNGSNVGTNSNSWTSTSLHHNDVVSCILTSNISPCPVGSPATSNNITMTVNDLQQVSVSLSATATTICQGTNVTFTATPSNGGSTPSYQWKLNNANVGVNSPTYSDSTLANNDNVRCVMTSNITPCPTGNPATSNSLTITVNSSQPVTVSISASPSSTVCSGTSVTFSTQPGNGGSSPSYQWKLNGTNSGTGSTYASSVLANGDVISCVMTSSITPCPTGNPATSNSITETVNPLPLANTGDSQNVCLGETIGLGAIAVSGNTYSWTPSTYLSSTTVSNPTFSSSTAGTTTYTLTESITATGCTKSNTVKVKAISGGGNPSFTCNQSNLVVSTPFTDCVSPGSNDYLVMKIQITLGGGCSGAQRKLQTLKFNATSGTCSNIENAKLWYSGNSGSFTNAYIVSAASTITSVSCSSNNTWNAGTLQVMQPGDNFFWVTYKIRSTATVGQSVQATLVSVTVVANGNTTCSTFGGSTSSRQIQSSGCPGYRRPFAGETSGLDVKAFPNPFHQSVTIQFASMKDARVQLAVYSVTGELIRVLFDGLLRGNEIQESEFNGTGLSAGIYYYSLKTEEEIRYGKLLLVR